MKHVRIVLLALMTFSLIASVIVLGRWGDERGNIFGLIDQVLLWSTFGLIVKYRMAIANYFLKWPLHPLITSLGIALPFLLVEENVNCLKSGCKLIPLTLPALFIFLIVVMLIAYFTRTGRFWLLLSISCAAGILYELAFGDTSAEFRTLPPLWFAYISAWAWMGYAYFTVVPLTYLIQKRRMP